MAAPPKPARASRANPFSDGHDDDHGHFEEPYAQQQHRGSTAQLRNRASATDLQIDENGSYASSSPATKAGAFLSKIWKGSTSTLQQQLQQLSVSNNGPLPPTAVSPPPQRYAQSRPPPADPPSPYQRNSLPAMSPTAPPPKPPRAAKVAAVSTTSAAQPSSPTLSYQGPPPSSASAPPSPTVTVRKRPPKYQLPPEFGAKYAVRDELGIGGYGYIFSALRKKDGKEVAVKLLPREYVAPNRWTMDPGLGPVPMELWVMKNVVHPGIVQFYDLYQNKDVLLIVMELFGNSWKNLPYNNSNPTVPQPADQFLTAGNGNNASSSKPAEDIIPILGTIPSRRRSSDLFELLEVNALTEHEVHAIFVQLVDTLEHLYTYHGIIHGDIKDENVLVARLQNGEVKVKLIDFGAAVRVRPGRYHHTHREDSDDASASDADLLNPAADCSCGKRLSGQTFCGTLEFAPPEVLKGDPFYDGERAQIWSVGVLLYDMLYRCMPFADVQAAISKPFAKNPTVEVSPSCIDLLEKLLQKDPVARLPLEEIKNHPWFVQGPAKAA